LHRFRGVCGRARALCRAMPRSEPSAFRCPGVYENALTDLDSSPHTWSPTYDVGDPTVADAPYSSYAATEGTSQLVSCQTEGTCPGVYENALGDLDTTPHVWNQTPWVQTGSDPFEPVAPYSSMAGVTDGGAVPTTHLSLFYEGNCNPFPGWEPTWNPPETGCGYNDSIASPVESALAAPIAAPAAAKGSNNKVETCPCMVRMLTQRAQRNNQAGFEQAVRAAPGHLLLMSHSLLFGLASATSSMISDVVNGKGDALDKFNGNFKAESAAAAESVTPVGGYVLRKTLEVQ